jgi:hypothetical protein
LTPMPQGIALGEGGHAGPPLQKQYLNSVACAMRTTETGGKADAHSARSVEGLSTSGGAVY